MIKETASIGHVGSIVFDRHNLRAKGILDQPYMSISSLSGTLKTQLDNLRPHSGDITRITARAFIGNGLTTEELEEELKVQNLFPGIKLGVDAIINLPENGSMIRSLVYLGGNSQERQRPEHIVRENETMLATAQDLAQRTYPDPLPSNFSTQLSVEGSGVSPQDLNDIYGIYSAVFQDYVTDITPANVQAMIKSNMIGIVRNGHGRIVSLTVAEVVPRIVDGITMIELTDSATDPQLHQSTNVRNVNHWARATLMEYFNDSTTGVTLIYSEARADLVPALRNNFWSGFQVAGTLPNSCMMSSKITSSKLDRGQYGDLVVMYAVLKK